MLRQQETMRAQRRFGLPSAAAGKRDQRRRIGRKGSNLTQGFRLSAQIQALCAWKPTGTERVGNTAQWRYRPPQQLRSWAAKKRFRWKNRTAAFDVRSPRGRIQKNRHAPQTE